MSKKIEPLGEPVTEEYREMLQHVASSLDTFFNGSTRGKNKKTGFVLLMFPYGSADGQCNFVSNGADRKDIVILFKEMIARFEGQPEIKGSA